jgi:TRAP-type transport system periplasmic protein
LIRAFESDEGGTDMSGTMGRRTVLKTIGGALVSAPFVSRSFGQTAITIRVSSALTGDSNSSHFVWYARFKSALESAVGTKVSLSYFPNNQLGKESDVVQQIVVGGLDMMISGTSIWATVLPEIGALDLGYIFSGNDHVGKALDGAAGQQLSKLLIERTGARVLGYGYSLGARNVYTKNPITSPEALKGVKLRVLPVPNFVARLKSMGANATPIPFGEIYASLQSGAVEGLEQDAPTVLGGKFYEVAKHCILTQHIFSPVIPVISRRAFERIPADLQPAFEAAAKDATTYQRGQAGQIEAAAFDELKKLGVTVSTVDRDYYRKLVEPLWKSFADNYASAKPILESIRAAAAGGGGRPRSFGRLSLHAPPREPGGA